LRPKKKKNRDHHFFFQGPLLHCLHSYKPTRLNTSAMAALRALQRLPGFHPAEMLSLRHWRHLVGDVPAASLLHSSGGAYLDRRRGAPGPAASRQLRLAATATASPPPPPPPPAPFKLVLYSKQDCPLCDKLKEKLGALMDRAAFMPSLLSGVELEVRDIDDRPEWAARYGMAVPVLAAAPLDGGVEVRGVDGGAGSLSFRHKQHVLQEG
jgi:hypothetical protein